jgi:hypothetical protein
MSSNPYGTPHEEKGTALFSPTMMMLGQEEDNSPAPTPDGGYDVDHLQPATNAQDHPQQRQGDEREPPPPAPLCSILNTVVDFAMMPPTELFEPEEYQQRDSLSVQVPVLRFFGPIVRRLYDAEVLPTNNVPPQQSACLYIHGAFPYMVARPVLAGPDGSGTGTCPWDSVAAVQRMVPALTESLEVALQETNKSFASGEKSVATTLRVVRRITVVTGRGFYTYCPGPAAPFLRIEYYCPADRWKVKRCLERGLADLPVAVYHPAQQEQGEKDDLLRFNCYEAHIPYTMQFFKDWNLAGMSYIHVASTGAAVKFRHALPTSIRNQQKYRRKQNDDNDEVDVPDVEPLSRSYFLASNTPSKYLWGSGDDTFTGNCVTDEVVDEGVVRASLLRTATDKPRGADGFDEAGTLRTDPEDSRRIANIVSRDLIRKKQTSCDLELDISVFSILNVFEVMTDLPDDWEARQQIHWRAVPSLREIWSQERRRMAKLLKPQDDFLSGAERSEINRPLPFTLNVKKDASLPGAKLAREGMQRLVQVTGGLEESFRRAMKQIVERHAESVNRTDSILLRRNAAAMVKNGSVATIKGTQTPRDDGCNVDIGDGQVESATGSDDLTPSHDEAMEALGALGSLFEESSDKSTTGRASSLYHDDGHSQHEAVTGLDCEQDLSQSTVPSSSQPSQNCSQKLVLSLSQACFSRSLERAKDSIIDEYMMSQRVERGDGIVGSHFECIDDVIDPETLAPYEAFDDEDGEDDSLGDDDEGDDLDEGKMEQLLSTLATQTLMPNSKELYTDGSVLLDDDSSMDSLLSGRRAHGGDVRFGSDDEVSVVETEPFLGPAIAAHPVNGTAKVPKSDTACPSLSNRLESYGSWKHPAGISIEFRELPPMRKELIESAGVDGLYPMQLAGTVSPWTTSMAEYENIRCAATRKEQDWFPPSGRDGVDVLQVSSAPTRKTVVSWYRKRCKRPLSSETHGSAKPKRPRTSNDADACLLVDQDARKLVVGEAPDMMQEVHGVEEVDWKLSQQSNLSATQDTEKVKDDCSLSNAPEEASQSTRESHGQVEIGSSGPTRTFSTPFDAPSPDRALAGMGNQGGRLLVEGGGQLKARTKQSQLNAVDSCYIDEKSRGVIDSLPCAVSIMAIEVYIQCRTGRVGVNDTRLMAMTPDSDRDKVCSVVYILSRDPGGGEPLEFLERGCIFVPIGREIDRAMDDVPQSLDHFADGIRKSMSTSTLGVSSPLSIECVRDERQLLLRLASIVRWKDPDMLLSWDTQGSGLGYLIERGAALGKDGAEGDLVSRELDMARLLGRTPTVSSKSESRLYESDDAAGAALDEMDRSASKGAKVISTPSHRWKGSGLGTEWDERVGAGAAAASIVSTP